MYYCQDCKKYFERARRLTECHGLDCPPFERYYVCPFCLGHNFKETEIKHCRCCGARLAPEKTDYCNHLCRTNGEKLWRTEEKRKRERMLNPVNATVAQVELYNRKNGTSYSYGQFVSLVLPKIGGVKN